MKKLDWQTKKNQKAQLNSHERLAEVQCQTKKKRQRMISQQNKITFNCRILRLYRKKKKD